MNVYSFASKQEIMFNSKQLVSVLAVIYACTSWLPNGSNVVLSTTSTKVEPIHIYVQDANSDSSLEDDWSLTVDCSNCLIVYQAPTQPVNDATVNHDLTAFVFSVLVVSIFFYMAIDVMSRMCKRVCDVIVPIIFGFFFRMVSIPKYFSMYGTPSSDSDLVLFVFIIILQTIQVASFLAICFFIFQGDFARARNILSHSLTFAQIIVAFCEFMEITMPDGSPFAIWGAFKMRI